jgi:hypothetical protein
VSRREAREARKKIKKLRGRDWTDIPAADRVLLRATADARDTVGSQIGIAFIALMIVAVAGAAIVYGVVELGPAIRAALGDGTRGWFVAQQVPGCQNPGCHWGGLFESLDQHVILRNVSYADADHAMRLGSVVPALFTGGDMVYAPGGSTGWLEPAVFLLIGIAVIAALLWYGPIRYVRHRLRDRQIHRDLQVG